MTIIKILRPSLDDVVVEGNPCLRGVIDITSLRHLRIDASYQREFLSTSTRRWIVKALANHQRLPDIELGMRGQHWTFDESQPEFDIADLHDPVFIIDGQQRRGTILEHLKREPGFDPRLGAIVHFGSTMEWERQRFHDLNMHRAQMASSIAIRNMRSTCTGIATAYGLTVTDKDFPLHNRVGWNQALAVKDLMSATTYVKAILIMHGHFGGGVDAAGAANFGTGMDKLTAVIGLPNLRANIKAFWEVFQHCWDVRGLTRRGSTWTRVTFINALADVFSDHSDFWIGPNDQRFNCPTEIRDKLEKFPVNDPEIRSLAASSGQARNALVYHLTQWIDKGRRNLMHKRNLEEMLQRHRATALRDVRAAQREYHKMQKDRRHNGGLHPPPQ